MPLLARCLLLIATLAGLAAPAARANQDFLEPEKAFRVSARALDASHVEVAFDIERGYYMYREQFRVTAGDAKLGAPVIPPGKVKFDETFQKDVETHRDRVALRVPVESANGPFRMTVVSQGCADAGLCYPPMASVLDVRLAAFGGDGSVRVVSTGDMAPPPGVAAAGPVGAATGASPPAVNTASPTDGARIDAALRSGSFWLVVGVFFVAGVLLSFTPCVLPMLPILSSIIAGDGAAASRGRSLALAASYSLGMAVVYTALGIAAGLAGEGLAAWLQTPWVLALFAAALVAFALSMFGFYEIRMPAAWTGGAVQASQRLRGGRVGGVFAMGGVSALIVSPCVAAPLAGALVYLSQTRDVVLGGTALFALAAGMSVPLLLLGASAGALLPKAGAWMEDIKRFFGLLLLGVAIWIVQPVLPASLALALWGALLIGAAVWLGLLVRGAAVWRRALGAIVAVGGVLQIVGAASGGTDPLQPLAHLAAGGAPQKALGFTVVRNVAELDAAIATAGKPVMLDFYADWCVSCKEMERFTFSDPQVRERLGRAVLLKADVTANSADDRALLRRFGLFGPPGTLFFDASGREITGVRVIGYQDATRFLQTLQAAGL